MGSTEEAELKSDFFLRQVPNVKIGREEKEVKPEVRAEMKTLSLSRESQKIIMETLKHVHGPDFSLADISSYINKTSNLASRYWLDRGTLVVRGGSNNIHAHQDVSPQDKFRMFAVQRLRSYGFHSTHCNEALDRCDGEVDTALRLLYSRYYDIQERPVTVDCSDKDLLEQRTDEKSVLHSIYGQAFEEKILNSVWVLTFNLAYIVNFFNNNKMPKPKPPSKVKKKDMCKNFQRGVVCKFGNACRFSHHVEKEEKDTQAHLRHETFELEIRFPTGSRYPYEPPLIFLKSDAVLPEQTCMRICRRLIAEAADFATNGIVCVYALAELINSEDDVVHFLKTNQEKFIGRDDPLFPPEVEEDVSRVRLPSHYRKGLTNKDNKTTLTKESVLRNDQTLARQYLKKQNEPSYTKYLQSRRKLPAWSYRDRILRAIEGSQVAVISGETGCGKSTQVPQFILDDWLANFTDNHIEVVCTQPRRISAIGVAKRVADERTERVGESIGYSIRLENKISSLTRLTFCTTGILLRRLKTDPCLTSVSHVIVDEVHERSEESDFLLLILKDLLPLRPDLKVILMSATMNAQIFCDYFGNVPIVDIPGRTFPVEQLFLEDILELTNYVLEENSQFTRKVKKIEDNFDEEWETCDVKCEAPKDVIKDENLTISQLSGRYSHCSKLTCKNLYLMDTEKVNLELIEHILMFVVSKQSTYPKTGSILVFLPGIAEITAMHDQLNNSSEFSSRHGRYLLLPLHSTLSSEEQAAIFKKAENGVRKIILSTNIAETSVTIDDCVLVIDCGKMKEKRFDPNRNMESLEMVWTSRANALQRKGRAGRVMPGVCIHLMTRHRFTHHILAQPVPELQRVPLEQLLLRIKVISNFDDRSLAQVLDGVLEPPTAESVNSAIVRLQQVGAFDDGQQLTPLGVHLAELPVDVRIGKLMLFGAIFCCTDAALTMAACLSYKSPFVSPFGKRMEAAGKRKQFAQADSDQITDLKAYNRWRALFAKSRQAAVNFAQENFLSMKTLSMLSEIKYQLLELLVSIGFVPVDLVSQRKSPFDRVLEITGPQLNINGENLRVLSAVLCAALYPNVVKILTPEKSYFLSAGGAVPKQLKPEDFRFRTKQDGYVFLHPSSVNYVKNCYSSSYMIYQEKIKTSRVFLRDCTVIPNIPLVLFSGSNLNVEVHNGTSVILLEDGWVMFQVEKHEVAELLKMIRIELFQLLDEKIRDPCLNLLNHENGNKIISTIVRILSDD